jgi:hypothetical protein
MKPYGREKKVKGWKNKVDYHVHTKKGRKIRNWWEEIINLIPRTTIKQKIRKEISML